eukprot:4459721-Prymnesium_polylepis.1
MTPRQVATPTFRGVYEDYRRCAGSTFDNLEARCCGSGPTTQMVGAFSRALHRRAVAADRDAVGGTGLAAERQHGQA